MGKSQIATLCFLPKRANPSRKDAESRSFLNNWLRPLGMALWVVQSVHWGARRVVSTRGYKAETDDATPPTVTVGGESGNIFVYDAARPMRAGALGQAIDPVANPVLAALAKGMNKTAQRAAARSIRVAGLPEFPRLQNAFGPGAYPGIGRPTFVGATAALKNDTAKHFGYPSWQRLEKEAGPQDSQALYREQWEQAWELPTAAGNHTGCALIPLAYHPFRGLRVYEDFRHLMGRALSNPAARLASAAVRIVQRVFDNPARHVMQQYAVDYRNPAAYEQLGQSKLQQLLEQLRYRLPGLVFCDEDLMDALVHVEQPLLRLEAGETREALLEKHRSAAVDAVNEVRRLLGTADSEQCTDDDILRAIRCPRDRLLASGAARIQLWRIRDGGPEQAFFFPSSVAGCHRTADLWTVRPQWRPTKKVREEAPDATPAANS